MVATIAVEARKRYASKTVERSIRLSILEHAFADVAERLRELPPSRDAEALRSLARQYESELSLWKEHPPEESKRVALLKHVLDLNVQIIRAGGPPSTSIDEEAAGDSDDDFPKFV